MIPARLRAREREIRRDVARRRYADLPGRLDDLRRIAVEHLAELPKGDPVRTEIIGCVLAVTEWARLMLTTQRQFWSAELQRLPLLVRYARGRYPDRADHTAHGTCFDL